MAARLFRDCWIWTFEGLLVAEHDHRLGPDGAAFSGVVTVILVGGASHFVRLAVAFATPAPPDPALAADDVAPDAAAALDVALDDALDDVLPDVLDEPQAASASARTTEAEMAHI